MEITTWEDRERWGIGRMLSLYEIEGLAYDFLSLVDCLTVARPDVYAILELLEDRFGVTVRWEAPPETRGWSHRKWLFIQPGLPPDEEIRAIVHELSHWFLTDEGVPTAMQDIIIDQFVLCWRMPRATVQFVVERRQGFIFAIDLLVLMYIEVAPPLDLIVRAAMVCNVGLLTYSTDTGLTLVGAGVYEVNVVLDEAEAIACARQAMQLGRWVPDPRGFVAIPLQLGDMNLAVVAVDLGAREWVWRAG